VNGELAPIGAAAEARRAAGDSPAALTKAPSPNEALGFTDVAETTHAKPGSGRMCPMCKKVHGSESQIELAA